MPEHRVSAGLLGSPVLSRFAGVPSLVAGEALDRFEWSLAGLATVPKIGDMLSECASSDDGFWPAPEHWMARYRPYVVSGGILQIPVKGLLLADFSFAIGSYATGYTYLRRALERGLEDPGVRSIAWLHDSGGGEVSENFDLCDFIYASRTKKRMRAFCEFSYSASYSLATAAGPIHVTRTGGVGSVGVVTMHVDVSRALNDAGVKVTLVDAPKGGHKTDLYPYKPLNEDGKDHLQGRADALYDIFVKTVARNRDMDEAKVRATKATTFMAGPAIDVGFADSIGVIADEVTAFAAEFVTTEGNEDMTTPTAAKTFSQADVDQARAEGVTAGKAEAGAANAAAVAAASADGEKKGATAAYARVSTVLADPKVKGRERAAVLLACKSPDMAADDVCAFVAENGGSATSLDQRMNADGTNAAALPDAGKERATEPDFAARMKARHGVK